MTEPLPSFAWLVDVGGTRIRIAKVVDGAIVDTRSHLTGDYKELGNALRACFESGDHANADIFIGAAGPVRNGAVWLTNKDFVVDSAVLAEQFPGKKIHLLNDVEAVAYGVFDPPPAVARALREGEASPGAAKLAIVPGTGLGAAVVLSRPGPFVLPTEFGQLTAAPAKSEHLPLFDALIKRYGRLPSEFLVSGPGLLRIYHALSELDGLGSSSHDALTTYELFDHARLGDDPIAQRTIDIFSSLLGSTCGDGALANNASGGVYLAGSLMNAFKDLIASDEFVSAFEQKGLISHFVKPIPVYLLTFEEPVLEGLLAYAARTSEF
ncbi:glucokinase [Hyphococcus sp.]|uniref:glucokinase n=1 Tax=Hyphococcus sp. TaxID=2038636 RepID=UPI002088EBA6|nr:MAG: glucokinase [Marinicaulis sp.]